MNTVFGRWQLSGADRVLGRQLVRYFFAAGTAALVDLTTVGTVLQLSDAHYLYAIGLGFITGTTTNFLLSHALVFARIESVAPVYIKHFTSSLVGLTVNVSVVVSLVELLLCPVMLAKVLALTSSFFVNFFLIKFFAFRDHRL